MPEENQVEEVKEQLGRKMRNVIHHTSYAPAFRSLVQKYDLGVTNLSYSSYRYKVKDGVVHFNIDEDESTVSSMFVDELDRHMIWVALVHCSM